MGLFSNEQIQKNLRAPFRVPFVYVNGFISIFAYPIPPSQEPAPPAVPYGALGGRAESLQGARKTPPNGFDSENGKTRERSRNRQARARRIAAFHSA